MLLSAICFQFFWVHTRRPNLNICCFLPLFTTVREYSGMYRAQYSRSPFTFYPFGRAFSALKTDSATRLLVLSVKYLKITLCCLPSARIQYILTFRITGGICITALNVSIRNELQNVDVTLPSLNHQSNNHERETGWSKNRPFKRGGSFPSAFSHSPASTQAR